MTDLVSGYAVRILIVSASEQARDEVGEALRSWSHDYRLHWVSQPSLAIVRAEELVPELVLIDDHFTGITSVFAHERKLHGSLPPSHVVVLFYPRGTVM